MEVEVSPWQEHNSKYLIPLLDECKVIDEETGRQLHSEAVAGDKAYRSERKVEFN